MLVQEASRYVCTWSLLAKQARLDNYQTPVSRGTRKDGEYPCLWQLENRYIEKIGRISQYIYQFVRGSLT